MTPLLDAIVRTIALAEADNPDKAVIVIMTDGHENASREVTRDGVKVALDRVRARGWEVVFLGANFDNISDASSVGVCDVVPVQSRLLLPQNIELQPFLAVEHGQRHMAVDSRAVFFVGEFLCECIDGRECFHPERLHRTRAVEENVSLHATSPFLIIPNPRE
jgi:hypothetical protein